MTTKAATCIRKYMPEKPKVSEVLRRELKAAEKATSMYRIAQDTGLARPSLIRFRDKTLSLRLDKADVLAEYLGLELVKKKGASRGKRDD